MRKREFLEKLSDNIHDVLQEDLLMVAAGDMNCHIGSICDGFEDVIGCFSFESEKPRRGKL